MNYLSNKKEDNNSRMPPDLLHAAMTNDFTEAINAISQDPLCYKKTDLDGRNALQIAILNFHDEMSLFLLNNTEIRVSPENTYGENALDICLKFGSETLSEEIFTRWSKEIQNISRIASKDGPTPH